jgi:hypothetical protein
MCEQLTTKRDIFFRETPNTAANVVNSSSVTKDVYFSRADRERERIKSDKIEDNGKPMLAKDCDTFVGFSDLPNQIHRRTVKKGFEFTLMVVGMYYYVILLII